MALRRYRASIPVRHRLATTIWHWLEMAKVIYNGITNQTFLEKYFRNGKNTFPGAGPGGSPPPSYWSSLTNVP